jgi:hypothetical protein
MYWYLVLKHVVHIGTTDRGSEAEFIHVTKNRLVCDGGHMAETGGLRSRFLPVELPLLPSLPRQPFPRCSIYISVHNLLIKSVRVPVLPTASCTFRESLGRWAGTASRNARHVRAMSLALM